MNVQKEPVTVVKLGSEVVAPNGIFATQNIDYVASYCVELLSEGTYPLIVSSGAINTGRTILNNTLQSPNPSPESLPTKQLLSTIGQPTLMSNYQRVFTAQGLVAAQILVTHNNFENHEESANLARTIDQARKYNVIEIINEDDAADPREIDPSQDNDVLAKKTATLVNAARLVLITSSVGGLLDSDGVVIPLVELSDHGEVCRLTNIEPDTVKLKNGRGRGGIKTKARVAMNAAIEGMEVVIMGASDLPRINRAFAREFGTYFEPVPIAISAQ